MSAHILPPLPPRRCGVRRLLYFSLLHPIRKSKMTRVAGEVKALIAPISKQAEGNKSPQPTPQTEPPSSTPVEMIASPSHQVSPSSPPISSPAYTSLSRSEITEDPLDLLPRSISAERGPHVARLFADMGLRGDTRSTERWIREPRT